MKRGVQSAERGVRNLVAADVSPLHLIPREVRADSRRLLRLGSSARSACVFLWLLFIASSHARPFRKTADDIPELAPPLPEILPTFWEQYGWMLWLAALCLLLVISAIIAVIWLRPRKPPVLPATAAPGGLGTLLPVGVALPSTLALRPLPLASAIVPQVVSSST